MRAKHILTVLMCAMPITMGWQYVSIAMSLDYFEENVVKFVCLLTCRPNTANLKFTKAAFTRSISISQVDIIKIDDTKLSSCLKQPMAIVGVLLDLTCASYQDVLTFASSNMLLDISHKWLLVDEGSTEKFNISGDVEFRSEKFGISDEDHRVIEFVEGIDTSVNSDIVIAKKSGEQAFYLREVFNFGKTKQGVFIKNILGTWDSKSGLRVSKCFKYYRRWDFRNTTLRNIVVMSGIPERFDEKMVVGPVGGPGVNVVTHIGAIVLDEIAKMHNIRYNYTVVDQWIGQFEKNSTRVVSNSLYFREQDISPVIRLFKYSLDYIDILHPQITSIETRYYYRILSYGPGRFENQFLTPLAPAAWWGVAAMAFACGLVLLLTGIEEQHPSTWQYALFSVIATVCQQSGKLTILVTGIFCVLVYNYYTSSVVSWLLNGPPPSLNSLWDLLESPLKLAYEEVGYTKTWIQLPDYNYNKKNAKVELEMRRRKVWNKRKGEPLMVPLNEGIELIRGGEYAYHMEVNTANRLIAVNFDQTELCELGSLPSMERTSLYPAVQKNSPYREFYIWSIARLSERGVVKCVQQRLLSPGVACEGSSPRALALGGAAPAFVLLGLGGCLSLVIMVVERLIHGRRLQFLN